MPTRASALPQSSSSSFQQVQQGLLRALGYTITPRHLELQAGISVPVWQMIGDPGKAPQVLVVPAYNPGQEEDDILDQHLAAVHYGGVPAPPGLADADYASIVSDALFGADHAPRFIVLVGLHEWLLLDRFKWPNSRAPPGRFLRHRRAPTTPCRDNPYYATSGVRHAIPYKRLFGISDSNG